MKVLVTGAAGKVGTRFISEFLSRSEFSEGSIVALCHNRPVEESDRVSTVFGSISDREVVRKAVEGITHVIHLATCKETPEDVMDVTVKGMFWLLEECRDLEGFESFILVGGDAAMGHFFYKYPEPVTEKHPHRAYPGCYALSKVLEEVMLEQFQIQYDFPGCTLRAPWIMEKDDFKYSLSFGEDIFGGPRWRDLVKAGKGDEYHASGSIPLALNAEGEPLQRNFVHVDDLVDGLLIALNHPEAHQQLFNISMDEAVDYGKVAAYLKESRNVDSVEVETPYQSTWLDNSKARFLLGWRPKVDLTELIDRAWDYQRSDDDPRKIWYPG